MPAEELRILLLNNRWETGGTQRHLRDLASGLTARCHRVWIAAWTSPFESDTDQSVIHLPIYRDLGRRKSPLGFVSALRSLSTFIHTERIDVVHMHSRYVLPLGRYAAKGSSARLLYTAHYHTSNLSALPWYPHVILFPSKAMQDGFLRSVHNATAHEMHVIPHGIADIPFDPPVPVPGKFIFIGRHVRQKGGTVLLDALAILKDQGSMDNTVQFIGDGPDRTKWEKLAVSKGIDHMVEFTGAEKDVTSRILSAEGVVAPSLTDEGFGYVMLEAMLAAVPVICSDLPAYREIDGGANHAFLFPPGDAEALAGVMQFIRGHPPSLQARLASARDRVRNIFPFDRMIEDTIAVYRRLVTADQAPSQTIGLPV